MPRARVQSSSLVYRSLAYPATTHMALKGFRFIISPILGSIPDLDFNLYQSPHYFRERTILKTSYINSVLLKVQAERLFLETIQFAIVFPF